MDIKSIIRKVLNEIENKNIRKAYDLSDIPIEDDDTANNAQMHSLMMFKPKDKHDLKAWILRKVITEGPNADLNNVDLTNITDMSYVLSVCDEWYFLPSYCDSMYKWININICDYIPYSELRTMPRRSDLGLNGKWRKNNLNNDVDSIFDSMNPDISEWHVDKVVNMDYMFTYNTAFNNDISGWHVDNVESMDGMFWNAASFDQDISSWNVDKCFMWCDIKVRPDDYKNNYLPGRDHENDNVKMFAGCPIKKKHMPYPFRFKKYVPPLA